LTHRHRADTLHAVNASQLATYLQQRMPAAKDIEVSGVARVGGGASRETWTFDARWTEDGAKVERGFICRRDPPASLLESNAALEFELYSALAGSGVPVPQVLWMEHDGQALERPCFVMERLPGTSDGTGQAFASLPEWADTRPLVTKQHAEILARIHAFNIDKLPSLDRPATAAASAEHEIARWERTMRADMLEPQPTFEMAFNWLKRHIPPPPKRLALVHGDYRTGNFLIDKSGITGVLDWEMAHAGDPLEDVGWLCMKSWRLLRDERIGGICTREEFIDLYEKAGGAPVDPASLKFWDVFSNVKFAIIFITGTKSIVQGKTADITLALTAFINPGLEVELLELIA
jgi:aminoglycoside phosphotransferase (APT) family kinase protein